MSTKEEEIDLPSLHWFHNLHTEEFEDTKGVTRNGKSKNRQRNGQRRKDKQTNNDLQINA